MEILYAVVLPRRVIPQPEPFLSPGGDCSACVLAGLLDVGLSEVYAKFCEGKPSAPSRFDVEHIVEHALREGFFDRVITGVPFWPSRKPYLAFGFPGYLSFPDWFEYVRMGIDAGYYGIASVVFAKTGTTGTIPPETDHSVLICGAREVAIPHPSIPGSARIDREILVSCSARSSPMEEWVEVKDFLAQRGGYNVILVRPTGGVKEME